MREAKRCCLRALEAGIPEDDPRNPAVIADNVGDNVGDVAGMGADLFESYVAAIISAIILGTAAYNVTGVQYTLAFSAVGVVASVIGVFFVRGGKDPQKSLNNGTLISSVIIVVAGFFLSRFILESYRPFAAVVSGLVVGLAISRMTEYFTSAAYKPVKKVSKGSETGASTNIISGLSVGMMSTVGPIVMIGIGILASYFLAGARRAWFRDCLGWRWPRLVCSPQRG